MVTRAAVLATMLALAAVACDSGSDAASEAAADVDLSNATEPPSASDLAPSQTTASTVTAPDVPPPCDADDLHWVADPATDDDALFLIRVRNVGGIECELDVSQSEIADPAMEPDVWLAPGAIGELMVVDAAPGCDDPEIDPSVELVVNGTPVDVTLGLVDVAPWCQLAAVAIYVV